MSTPTRSTGRSAHWLRACGIAVLAAAIFSLILLAFSWPTVTSQAKNLPVAVVGNAEQRAQLGAQLPADTFEVHGAQSREEAVGMIQRREVYGAVVLGTEPEVLIAGGGSPAAGTALRTLATQVQLQLDQRALAAGTPAERVPHITTTDVAPLSPDDPTGSGMAITGLPLALGGVVGGVLISLLVTGRRRRAAAVLAYGVVGGLALTTILQSWFGILQGPFWLNALAIGLTVAATAALINGLVSTIGTPGILLGVVITVLIGNPISGTSAPQEFLPWHFGAIGQYFVPGAGGSLLRSLSYFPDAPRAREWWVLTAWLLAGGLLILIGHLRAHAGQRRTAAVH